MCIIYVQTNQCFFSINTKNWPNMKANKFSVIINTDSKENKGPKQ